MLKLKSQELSSLKEHTFTSSNVTKLDISDNLLTDLEGIEKCQDNLKWMNASHNQIQSVRHLKGATSLNVLNLGYNKITSTKHLNKLKDLNALILNNNDIQVLDGLTNLKELNTLVVSSNCLENLDVAPLKKLEKLSASNNKFSNFPSLQAQKSLKDLKLNGNSIETIPDWLASSCIRIKVLDLGNNGLKDFDAIENLRKLPWLENLNLKGNALCDLDDYHIKMKDLFPNLKLLDFKKMSELYFKAIDIKSKSKTSAGDDNKAKEKIVVNPIPAAKKECSDSVPTSNSVNVVNRGFQSTKVKSKESVNEVAETDGKNDEKHSKGELAKKGNIATPDVSTENVLTQEKKAKKKKRKRKSAKPEANVDCEPDSGQTENDLESKKKKSKKTKSETGQESKPKENKPKENKPKENKPKENKSKENKPKMKTGIVSIKRKSKKNSKVFDASALYSDSISFGTGADAWK